MGLAPGSPRTPNQSPNQRFCEDVPREIKGLAFRPDPADPADRPDRPDQVSGGAVRDLTSSRTGGQDDGSLTNSLK